MAQGIGPVTITTQYLNNSTAPTTVSKSVPRVVVNNALVPDFRDINPGVVNSAYTEQPLPSFQLYN